jgi:cyclophilin family peptidyl-prolyl cis-trans isomerase
MTALRHSLRPLLAAPLAILFAFAILRAHAEAPPASPSSTAVPAAPAHPQVEIKTTQGDFVIELFPDKAPKTVANFLQYVKEGFYDGTVFHRVIPGYLVQGGLYTRDLRPKHTLPPIPDEANNGLSNLHGTVAAARGPDPDSATAQFFVNVVDNPRLDYVGNQSGMTWGQGHGRGRQDRQPADRPARPVHRRRAAAAGDHRKRETDRRSRASDRGTGVAGHRAGTRFDAHAEEEARREALNSVDPFHFRPAPRRRAPAPRRGLRAFLCGRSAPRRRALRIGRPVRGLHRR